MSYTPTDITFDPWSSPITIDGVDYISDLDDAVNSIITDDPQSLVVFINAQMAKMPPYLSAEMAKMYAEVEDSASEAATSASEAATSESSAATSASAASTSAQSASSNATSCATSAGGAETSAASASTSESNASNSASSASTFANNASISASQSQSYASHASTSETRAATSESNAATSESNAATSAAAAATSADEAAASGGMDSAGQTGTQNWVKFTDGTLIQYGSIGLVVGTMTAEGALFSTDNAFTFLVPFLDTNYSMDVALVDSFSPPIFLGKTVNTTTTTTMTLLSTEASGDMIDFSFFAIGRWE